MLENGVLRKIFGPKSEEITANWRKLHNDELHNLFTISNIMRVIKARRMRWTEHGELGKNGNACSVY